jgi:hypothetical protein
MENARGSSFEELQGKELSLSGAGGTLTRTFLFALVYLLK